MATENQEINYEELSDEDFMKLSEPVATSGEEEESNEDEGQNNESTDDNSADESDDDAATDDDDAGDGESSEESDGGQSSDESASTGNEDPLSGEGKAPDEGDASQGEVKAPGETQEKKDEKPKADQGDASNEGVLNAEQTAAAVDFYQKITAPFKADGKDFTVRSPEDAIRLMQQGVNYSRRMHELKPMRQMHRMLQDHGLNDVNKLSFLIDIDKGNVEAIKKLIKEKGIDYLDLDAETENNYETRSYAGNTKDNSFRDALDSAIENPDGRAILDDIHGTWDTPSKEALREDPTIIGNLIEQRRSGVYQKILDELSYQRTMGYLTDVPFLQAYDQVGLAMRNAGVFNKPNPQPAPATVPQTNTQPAGGKEQRSEEPAPNPHLSSKPPSTPSTNAQKPVDYDSLSDEDFMKMNPPG